MTATPSDNAAVTSGNKHTPGPWAVQDGWNVASGARTIVNGSTDIADDAESEANARLIAAAPDLLAAAREGSTDLMIAAGNARDASKTDPRWDGVAEKLMARVKMMDAAIRKAEAGQ